jgi:hypothetical protein
MGLMRFKKAPRNAAFQPHAAQASGLPTTTSRDVVARHPSRYPRENAIDVTTGKALRRKKKTAPVGAVFAFASDFY